MPPSPEPPWQHRLAALGRGWRGDLLAVACGGLVTLSLAPFGIWPLGILAALVLRALLEHQSTRVVLLRSWYFGIGLFGSGTSWVYVSIQEHGHASHLLATFLVILFVVGLSFLFNFTSGFFYALSNRRLPGLNWLVFPAYVTLGEWLKTWLLTGFPWIFLGYAHLETPLAGWAPIAGVLGISFIVALTGSVLYEWLAGRKRGLPAMAGLVIVLWGGGWLAQRIEWVEPAGEPVQIAMIQPNIPQSIKWQPRAFNRIIDTYMTMSEDLWGTALVIWPEAAIPRLYHKARPLIDQIDSIALKSGSTLITGIPYRVQEKDGERRLYNAVLALGAGEGKYYKQHLVPFGEYVPLEQWLRGLIDFFDLPMSAFAWGPADQPPLQAGPWTMAPFVCYEVVYPAMVANDTRRADFLLTISNDSWFGRSIGPPQHFEIARMRALENGRYLIRGTNNGISGITDHRGRVLVTAPQFTRTTLHGEAVPMRGNTLYGRTGNPPLLIFLGAIIATATILARRPR